MGTRTRRPRIQWAEDVVDNEGLGRKKSKGMLCYVMLCYDYSYGYYSR